MNQIYNSANLKITFESERKTIVWKPLAALNQQDWQGGFIAAITFYKASYMAGKQLSWINDTKLLKGVSAFDIAWLVDYMRPLGETVPELLYVQPDCKYAVIGLKMFLEAALIACPGLKFIVFGDYEQAVQYVEKNRA